MNYYEESSMLSKPMTPIERGWLRWLNLRPEESERTFLMFAFYTLTSVGVLWLEVSVAALFLNEYGAESLPWIYIASAGIGAGIGFIYSWLQKILSLRQVIVLIAVLMAAPLLLLRLGLSLPLLGGYTVFLMRLWLEAIYVANELNISITANQLFTIREIKRTYPLISSGILAADVVSGLSLPILRSVIGLPNVILLACLMLLAGATILFYLTQRYRQFFPDPTRRLTYDKTPDFTAQRLQGPLRQYVRLVFAFFIMLQVVALLLDFQYLSQLEQRPDVSIGEIADFLALFSAILGTVELIAQWFISGRIIERLGLFVIALLPPIAVVGLSGLTLIRWIPLFAGVVVLKFIDELLRYTLVASMAPVLFQPIVPEANRSRIEAMVRGIAEPLSAGLTGMGMLLTLWVFDQVALENRLQNLQSLMFVFYTLVLAAGWLLTVVKMRSKFTQVLVLSAGRTFGDRLELDLPAIRRQVIDVLDQGDRDDQKQQSIEFLTQVDPQHVGEIVAPRLAIFSPDLQRLSLEAMLNYPNPAYLDQVRSLTQTPLVPEVLTLALRYIWQSDVETGMQELCSYLRFDIDPVVRGTAAALLLRRGTPQQKAEATDILRRMLTHKREQERVMGCRALGEAAYLQSLRIYIQSLLQDDSLRVRRAVLEAIGATRLEEYYPALLRGLYYKSTREAAKRALVWLEDEALPMLLDLAEDAYKPEVVRNHAWMTIGQIGTPAAIDLLISHLTDAWGAKRHVLLRTLLKLPQADIDQVVDRLGRNGIETLINQELYYLAQLYASLLDLKADRVAGEAADLLRRALRDSITDAIERLFLLMRLLYDQDKIQAAAFNMSSASKDCMARGLEILDNTLDIPKKPVLLNILDDQSDAEKLHHLAEFLSYEALPPQQRLSHLLDLRHFLSDWTLACCLHVARQARWSLSPDHIVPCLRYPTGFVREAAIAYLRTTSPRILRKLLPSLKEDPHPLVLAQIQQMMAELGLHQSPNSYA